MPRSTKGARQPVKGQPTAPPLRWAPKGSEALHRSYKLNSQSLQVYGFGVGRLPPPAIEIVKQLQPLLEEHGPALLAMGGQIFNTKESTEIAKLRAEHGGNLDIDGGRSMATQWNLRLKAQPTVVEEAKVKVVKLMQGLSAILKSHLRNELLCGQIVGALWSLLCSQPGTPSQLVHVDMPYVKYNDSKLLVLVSMQDDTEIRVIPGSHLAPNLNGVKGVCERGIICILNEFDFVVMSPKLFHAGSECKKTLNYRLHYYLGFGSKKKEISGTTYYLPAEAVSASVASRSDKAKASKAAIKIKKELAVAAKASNLQRWKLSVSCKP